MIKKAPAMTVYYTLFAGADTKSEITEKEEMNVFLVYKQLCPGTATEVDWLW